MLSSIPFWLDRKDGRLYQSPHSRDYKVRVILWCQWWLAFQALATKEQGHAEGNRCKMPLRAYQVLKVLLRRKRPWWHATSQAKFPMLHWEQETFPNSSSYIRKWTLAWHVRTDRFCLLGVFVWDLIQGPVAAILLSGIISIVPVQELLWILNPMFHT